MATPLAGSKFHHSIVFKTNAGSWSESYWSAVTGSGDLKQTAEDAAGQLIVARMKVLPTDVSIVSMRTSDEIQKNATLLAVPPDFTMGPGLNLGVTEPVNYGWMSRSTAEEATTTGFTTHRGWIADDLNYKSSFGTRVAPPGRVRNWGIQMTRILCNAQPSGGAAARFCLRSYVKPTLLDGPIRWNTISQTNPKTLSITIPSSQKARFLVGQEVAIKVAKKKCQTGISGRGLLIGINTVEPVTSLIVSKSICCPPESFDNLVGTVFPIIPAYYAITEWKLVEVNARKAGRDFFLPRGKRPARCC